jgi:hypothetical protein
VIRRLPLERTWAAVAVLVLFSAARPAAADSPMAKTEAPISAKATPSLTLPGSDVTIAGTTANFGKGAVTLQVAGPGGKTAALKATVQTDGSFKAHYKPDGVGAYTVTLTAPDGKGTTTASFKVVSAAGLGADSATKVVSLNASILKAVTRLKEMQDSLPASPAKDESQKRLDDLQKKLAEVQKTSGVYQQSVTGFTAFLNANPDLVAAGLGAQTAGAGGGAGGQYAGADSARSEPDPSKPVIEDLMDGLRQNGEAEEKRSQEIDDVLQKSKSEGVQCELMDTAIEITNAIDLAFNVEEKALKFFINIVNDKRMGLLVDTVAKEDAKPDLKFHVTEAVKTATPIALLGGATVIKTALGVANDYAGWYLGHQFDKYCEKYEGPLTGHFAVQLRADNGNTWLTYSYDFEGKTTLRFAKQDQIQPDAKYQAYALTGRIEGNANHFKAVEDALQLDKNPAKLRQNLIFRHVFTPLGSPYLDELGLAGRTATPGYFQVPVTGELVKDKITLKFKNAIFDFAPTVKFQVVLVFLELVTGVPMVEMASMPAQDGYFFVSRGMHDHPEADPKDDPPTFFVKTEGKSAVATKHFARHYNDDKAGITVDWTIDAKLCNPSCLSTDPVTGLQKHE